MGFLLVFLSLTPFRWWIGINQELSRDMGRSTGLPDVILSATSTPLKFLQHSMYHLVPPKKNIGALLLGFSHLRNTPVSSCCWKKKHEIFMMHPMIAGAPPTFPSDFLESSSTLLPTKNPMGIVIRNWAIDQPWEFAYTYKYAYTYVYIYIYDCIVIYIYICLLCSCFPY